MQQPSNPIHLSDRRVIRVAGSDAAAFLQNVMTNDIAAAQPIVYSCLLSPQGQFLHDFFVVRETDDSFLVDTDAARSDELIRRLTVFKLRAKITMTPVDDMKVYAGNDGHTDPRHAALGKRLYTTDNHTADPVTAYNDLCISLGIPTAAAIQPERDVLSDINLDILNAVGWEKGCFIGQEVTARMKHRALAKKRLLIVEGNTLPPEAGEIRTVNSTGTKSLGMVKLAQFNEGKLDGKVTMPDYLK